MSRRGTHSAKCKHASCNNTVRSTYHSYPYCRHHAGLKDRRSRFSDSFFASMDGQTKGSFFSRPFKTIINPARFSLEATFSGSGLSRSTAKKIKKITTIIPAGDSDSARNADVSIYHDVVAALEHDKNARDPMIATAKKGRCILSGKGFVTVESKNLAVYTNAKNNQRYVVDVTTAATLPKGSHSDDFFTSGESITSDIMYVDRIEEYANYTFVRWQSIENNNGDILWQADTIDSDDSVMEDIKKRIASGELTIPKRPVFQVSPQRKDMQEEEYYEQEVW